MSEPSLSFFPFLLPSEPVFRSIGPDLGGGRNVANAIASVVSLARWTWTPRLLRSASSGHGYPLAHDGRPVFASPSLDRRRRRGSPDVRLHLGRRPHCSILRLCQVEGLHRPGGVNREGRSHPRPYHRLHRHRHPRGPFRRDPKMAEDL